MIIRITEPFTAKRRKNRNPLDNAGLIIYIMSIEKEIENVEPSETPCRTG